MNVATQNKLSQTLRPYLLSALKAKYGDYCAECLMPYDSYEIDHKRYGDDITIKDLQLLCYTCHREKTLISQESWLSQSPHCSTCNCFKRI